MSIDGFRKEWHLKSHCNSYSVFCCCVHPPDFSFTSVNTKKFSPQSGQQEIQERNKTAWFRRCLIRGSSPSVSCHWIQTSDLNKKKSSISRTNSRDSPNSWWEFCAWTKIKAEPVIRKSWEISGIQDFSGIYSSEACLGMIDEGQNWEFFLVKEHVLLHSSHDLNTVLLFLKALLSHFKSF